LLPYLNSITSHCAITLANLLCLVMCSKGCSADQASVMVLNSTAVPDRNSHRSLSNEKLSVSMRLSAGATFQHCLSCETFWVCGFETRLIKHDQT